MRMTLCGLCAGLAVLAAPVAGRADPMTFTLWQSTDAATFGQGRRDYIFADGEFVGDTAKKFELFLQAHPAEIGNATVVLNSGGGDLDAGLALGRLIRTDKLWTQVGSLLPRHFGVIPSEAAALE